MILPVQRRNSLCLYSLAGQWITLSHLACPTDLDAILERKSLVQPWSLITVTDRSLDRETRTLRREGSESSASVLLRRR